MASRVRNAWAPTLLMAASGAAALGYQILWTEQLALALGHDSAAVLAVVTAFFGGSSVGSLALSAHVAQSRRPARWYAGAELLIALWTLLLAATLPKVGASLLHLTSWTASPLWQWSWTFLGTLVLLLPATAAMGATLPAMERVCSPAGAPRELGKLYAANTAGAVVGVLATVGWLVPQWGLTRSALVCAVLNISCGAVTLALEHRFEEALPAIRPSADVEDVELTARRRLVLTRLAVTGFLGIGYEVLVVRVLSQVTESTVFTFAALLVVYLVGTALGAAAYQGWLERRSAPGTADGLLTLLSLACLVGTASLWSAEQLRASVSDSWSGELGAVLAEAAPAALAFGPPTLVMGALFSHLARQARRLGIGLGRALGLNTLGAALSPLAFGVLLSPALGPKLALLIVALGYTALFSRERWFRPSTGLAWAGALALAVLAPRLAFVDVPEGGELERYEDGVMAAVSVVKDASGVARLRINNRAQEGSSASQRFDGRQAWLPLLLHPHPERALFLGLGTGVTAASAADDSTLEVEAVELLPEVVRASASFSHSVGDGSAYARLRIVTADARRFVRTATKRYDVIVADNYHPARSGAGSLYTVEHFAAVRERLADHGIFCQWLPLHQLERPALASIVRSFLVVFPAATALIANGSLETPVLGLVGGQAPLRVDVAALGARIGAASVGDRLRRLGLEDELAVLGSFIAGPASLERLAHGAPPNTDDRPVVAYRAPRATYAPDSSPAERFITLLGESSIAPEEVLVPGSDALFSRRLAAYLRARDAFIQSGRGVRPTGRVEDMLAQVQEPLLSVLRISPDFRPAYDPLLAMAGALDPSNASRARALLIELARLQPARREASEALARLQH